MHIFCSSSGAPRFSDPSMLKRAFRAWPASHSIRLKCEATGAPPLKYKWLKDGVKMFMRRMDPYLNTSIWYLKLKDLVPNDSGTYTCIVSNPYGSINHTYTLQVVGEFSRKQKCCQFCTFTSSFLEPPKNKTTIKNESNVPLPRKLTALRKQRYVSTFTLNPQSDGSPEINGHPKVATLWRSH